MVSLRCDTRRSRPRIPKRYGYEDAALRRVVALVMGAAMSSCRAGRLPTPPMVVAVGHHAARLVSVVAVVPVSCVVRRPPPWA